MQERRQRSRVQSDLAELERLLAEEDSERKYNRLAYMYPASGELGRQAYPKQMQIFADGRTFRERGFMGGNGAGKTFGVGAYETALHATGLYPEWWPGKRFGGTTDIWAAGNTRETTRDIVQAKLFGDMAKRGNEAFGTGMIPRHLLGEPKVLPNTGKAFDYVPVRNASGDWSVIGLKSYEQGRTAFEGLEKHFIWPDEEPPEDCYVEMLMRGRKVDGVILTTFTPLKGQTPLVKRFMQAEQERALGRSISVVICGMDDVPHLTEKEKDEMLAGVPVWQRKARRTGYPTLGTGLIYPVDEAQFVVRPFQIPAHFRRMFGFDYGLHNTACVWIAIDDDTDTSYVYKDYKAGGQAVPVHAVAIKAQGHWIPGIGDSSAKDSDGSQIVQKYRDQGVRMRVVKKGAGSVAAGIEEMFGRLESGRAKVFSTCTVFLDEIRQYHTDEKGQIVKVNDHCLDAWRYAHTDLSVAITERRSSTFEYSQVGFG